MGPAGSADPAGSASSADSAGSTAPASTASSASPSPAATGPPSPKNKTRPAWLPPKNRAEDERHLAEFQRMMLRSQRADRKKRERDQRLVVDAERQRAADAELWAGAVMPRLAEAVATPLVRQLVARSGVPDRLRHRVWPLLIGNALDVDAAACAAACAAARAAPEVARAIDRDVAALLPGLGLFQAGKPLHDVVVGVLWAAAAFRPAGHQRAAADLAGTLLLHLDAADVFAALLNLMDGPGGRPLYEPDGGHRQAFHAAFERAFARHLPELYRHLRGLGLTPADYLDPLVLPLFARHLPPDTAARVWDGLLLDRLAGARPPRRPLFRPAAAELAPFEAGLVAAALAVLAHHGPRLLGDAPGVRAAVGWDAPALAFGAGPAGAAAEVVFLRSIAGFGP
ncbi:rab-GTPase-TBC domain-containing protein [Dipodascopsis tothii]|uniref:rab-GTPase-TBC domain-containing protein n=1 Tax=Dipodascopsis tothii TaxID=44089 RepID=UPI0034CD6317